MSMFSFDVGKKEIHTVSFEVSRIWGNYKISVDGNPIRKGMPLLGGSREAVLEIGTREKHKIRINWDMSIYGGQAQVFIGGKLFHTYKL